MKDKYPAYVSWETFEKIQAMLRDNYAEYDRNKTRGVPRDGEASPRGARISGAGAYPTPSGVRRCGRNSGVPAPACG